MPPGIEILINQGVLESLPLLYTTHVLHALINCKFIKCMKYIELGNIPI